MIKQGGFMIPILMNKCPRCHKGSVFNTASPFAVSFSRMHSECTECHLSYQSEQGFYWGAMYVSYGLTVLESFAAYIIARLAGIGAYDYSVLWPILITVVVLAPLNFRLSRMVWLYLFYPRS